MIFAYLWGLLWLLVASYMMRPFLDSWLNDLDTDERRLIVLPLTFGLGIGILTLSLFAIGAWQLNAGTVLIVPVIVLVSSLILKGKTDAVLRSTSVSAVIKKILQGDLIAWAIVVCVIVFIIVLGHATYYPFIGDDEISRYAYYAKLMWWRGQVTSDIRGYPMLMPMAYAYIFSLTNYIYQTTGQLSEQLARMIPVLFSLATVLATAALGRRWFGARGGITAALMLIITPLYLYWSADGYVDIPSALYFVLGAYSVDVWLTTRSVKWAVMAGAMTGLSLWAKQAGFAMLPALGLVFVWALTQHFRSFKNFGSVIARDGIIVLLVAFLFGGWWYARNIFYDGLINFAPTPGYIYTQQANTSILYLIPFIGKYLDFGVAASALYTLGLGWALLRLKRLAVIWCVLWAAPYTLLWWQLYSYDARFLLTVLPFYAILVGGCFSEIGFFQEPRFLTRVGGTPLMKWGAIIAILLGVAVSLRDANLGGARQWLLAPTASYRDRLIRSKGDLYPAVEFIRDYVPANAKIVSMDGRFSYYFVDRYIDVNYPATLESFAQYDYFVLGSWWLSTYDLYGASSKELDNLINDRRALERVYTGPSSSLLIYRVMK
ncbi:MAG: glycosyltransferase family 39 protein [Chloroflexi bacterium]|nr:glycosyltransferase family 39 protein [Chloroflexota bacterium]